MKLDRLRRRTGTQDLSCSSKLSAAFILLCNFFLADVSLSRCALPVDLLNLRRTVEICSACRGYGEEGMLENSVSYRAVRRRQRI